MGSIFHGHMRATRKSSRLLTRRLCHSVFIGATENRHDHQREYEFGMQHEVEPQAEKGNEEHSLECQTESVRFLDEALSMLEKDKCQKRRGQNATDPGESENTIRSTTNAAPSM